MLKQTIRDIDVTGRRVVVRVDYNVPIKDGVVGDTLRIESSFDTIRYLLEHGASIVLLSHLGRPEGQPNPKYSLAPVAACAAELLGHPVTFVPSLTDEAAKAACAGISAGKIILLENTRFDPREEQNDGELSQQLASYGDIFVNDAFAAIHRAHASTEGITHYLPSVAGLLVEREVDYITSALETPNRPSIAVVGGAKVSSKIEVLEAIIPKIDVLVLGGAMANTFFLASGHEVGKSLVEPQQVGEVKRLLEIAAQENTQLILPNEVVVSRSLDHADNLRTVSLDAVNVDDYIVDVSTKLAGRIGPAVIDFLDFDNKCTVIWNGPVGLSEVEGFAAGTIAVAEAIAALPGVTSIIGGGDTAAFIDDTHRHNEYTWVSTGGGASLELMSGKKLPGVEALMDRVNA